VKATLSVFRVHFLTIQKQFGKFEICFQEVHFFLGVKYNSAGNCLIYCMLPCKYLDIAYLMRPKVTRVARSHELTEGKAGERKNTVNKQLNYFVACITAHVRIKQQTVNYHAAHHVATLVEHI
jgi:hypothetical protein